jgi:hypothetical protein
VCWTEKEELLSPMTLDFNEISPAFFFSLLPIAVKGAFVKPIMIICGHLVLVLSLLFLLLGSYAVLFSAFLPLTGIHVIRVFRPGDQSIRLTSFEQQVLDALANDTHYKYFALLVIPTSAYFVIANWVGWQYYSNS